MTNLDYKVMYEELFKVTDRLMLSTPFSRHTANQSEQDRMRENWAQHRINVRTVMDRHRRLEGFSGPTV